MLEIRLHFFSEQEKWWKQTNVYWIKPVLTAKKLHVLMDLSVIINMLALKCLALFAKVAKTRWLEFRKILWCLFTILLGPKIQIGIVVITIRTSWKGVLSRYLSTYLFLLHFMIKSYVKRTGKVKMSNSNFYEKQDTKSTNFFCFYSYFDT